MQCSRRVTMPLYLPPLDDERACPDHGLAIGGDLRRELVREGEVSSSDSAQPLCNSHWTGNADCAVPLPAFYPDCAIPLPAFYPDCADPLPAFYADCAFSLPAFYPDCAIPFYPDCAIPLPAFYPEGTVKELSWRKETF